MMQAKIALLPDRGVVAVHGPDAAKLLQGIITSDMELLDREPSIHAGLLAPQGKILFDFFVVRVPEGYLLETARKSTRDLERRLMMYKLRADVEIADASADYSIAAHWHGEPRETSDGAVIFDDPRLSALGSRMLVSLTGDWMLSEQGAEPATQDDYHAHRVALGVPEAGRDFELGDAFPHEALYDQLAGVSFGKGCFVGQEVVSRMQHRGTARKRVVPVKSTSALPDGGTPVTAGTATIGSLGSVAGNNALAMMRLDRAAEAITRGDPLMAGPAAIEIELPEWAKFSLSDYAGSKDA